MNSPTAKIPVLPFPVPSSVSLKLRGTGNKQDGMQPSPVLQLEELDPETVDDLARTWLGNLYASVKRESPWRKTS